ncbi:TPA: neuraminidase-like domain-containing protein [Clostridioides difficile]|nr:hypothetical protein [Clostridioides difficile]HBE9785932.1 hypothetical protein [Clostridioides difficile]HBG3895170.1 hypothetical protein [Clostridioides difficile]
MDKDKLTQKEQLNVFYGNNPEFKLSDIELHKKETLDKLNLNGINKEAVLQKLMIQKRLYQLHASEGIHLKLIENNLISAQQIASMEEEYFVNTYSTKLEISKESARKIYKNAVSIQNKVMNLLVNIKTTVASPYFRNLKVNTIGDDTIRYFEKLPSYQEMFGSLDFCDCEDCKSIFGPAAYFVDLMRIIDKYITKPNEHTIDKDLSLNYRRPDLQEIALTCENTNNLVPYLKIVNERLYDCIKTLSSTEYVSIFEVLATKTVYPFNLPFNLNLEQIRVYLNQENLNLSDIYESWNIERNEVERERIGISLKQYNILTQRFKDDNQLANYYGISDKAKLGELNNTQTLLKVTQLEYNQLEDLLIQNISENEKNNNIAHNFYINQGLLDKKYVYIDDNKKSKGNSTSNPIANINNDVLDRVNRFIRLSKATSLNFMDLDWMINSIHYYDKNIEISKKTITDISLLLKLSRDIEFDVMDLCALIAPIKTYGEGNNPLESKVPFDIVYNNNSKTKKTEFIYHPKNNKLNPLYMDNLKLWNPTKIDENNIKISRWLSSSLIMSIEDLNFLAITIFKESADIDLKKDIELTVDNLSTLYRHSLLARKFKMKIETYIVLLKLCHLDTKKVFSIDDIYCIKNVVSFIEKSKINIYDLNYFINGEKSQYTKQVFKENNIDNWLKSLYMSIKRDSSSDIESEIIEMMSDYLGAEKELLKYLVTVFKKSIVLPEGIKCWTEAFINYSNSEKYKSYVIDVLRCCSRWINLVTKIEPDYKLVESIIKYPNCYGFQNDFKSYSIDNIMSFYLINEYLYTFDDVDYDMLNFIESSVKQEINSTKYLSIATNWNKSQIDDLISNQFSKEQNLVLLIKKLKSCFDIINKLKSDNTFIDNILTLSGLDEERNWTKYVDISNIVVQKVKGIYSVEEWKLINTKLQAIIESSKRDVLLSITLYNLNKKFADIKTSNDVYKYLLIDVEMDDSTQISYIVEALNATQLYLQRCRLKMEKGVESLNIPESWWSWIMNYRMWEANRKIFVYPENYLLPSIRHTKSEIFNKLESALSQSEITDAYIDAIYNDYIEEFSNISKLTIVSSYRCTYKDSKRGDVYTLFLFGRTSQQPYIYYYCYQEEGMPWTEWRKIDLAINSHYITPVFAFNKVFIFWVELKESQSTSIDVVGSVSKSNNSKTFKMDMYYSFLNIQQKWVNPQNILSEDLVYYTDYSDKDSIKNQLPFKNVFEMDSIPWLKVNAFSVNAHNFKVFDKKSKDFERINILYGPFANQSGKVIEIKQINDDGTNKYCFESKLSEVGENFNRLILANNTGYLPIQNQYSFNMNMNSEPLLLKNEFLLVDRYSQNKYQIPYKPIIDKFNNKLGIIYSQDVIYDNYLSDMRDLSHQIEESFIESDSFTSDTIEFSLSSKIFNDLKTNKIIDDDGKVLKSSITTLDLETVLINRIASKEISPNQLLDIQKVLFSHIGGLNIFNNINHKDISIMPIYNQVGSFVFDNVDETFMISPEDKITQDKISVPRFSMLSDGLVITRPPASVSSFLALGLSYDKSVKCIKLLKNYGLLDENNIVKVSNIDYNIIEIILSNAQLDDTTKKSIYRMLMNFPIINKYSFVNNDISKSVSETIYNTFEYYKIIDSHGRADGNNLTYPDVKLILKNQIEKGTIKVNQIYDIYEKLVHSPVPVTFKYENLYEDKNMSDLSKYKFNITRLSTGAIKILQKRIFIGGIDMLLSTDSQNIPVVPILPFDRFEPDKDYINYPSAIDGVQVDFDGLYGEYYWELFYHAPMLLADNLRNNQNYAQAQRWYQYVFNPTNPETKIVKDTFSKETEHIITDKMSEDILSVLKTKKIGNPAYPIIDENGSVNSEFKLNTDLSFLTECSLNNEMIVMVRNLLMNKLLATPSSCYWNFQPFRTHILDEFIDTLDDSNPAMKVYNNDPFNPHAIARLRMGAYEKYTVIQYIENIIEWADKQFMQDTWESITSATMLYILASSLLGERPVNLGRHDKKNVETFKSIQTKYKDCPGGIPQFLIDLENHIPNINLDIQVDLGFNNIDAYFEIPENEELIKLWDIVDDRLNKIRHSMNIKGEKRFLELYQPPISPELLSRVASSINNVNLLAESLDIELSNYRFSFLIEKAKEFAGHICQLGTSLLNTIEKNDAESMAVLHSIQENNILNMVTMTKEKQIEELNETIKSMEQSLKSAEYKNTYYENLIKNGLSEEEQTNLDAMGIALFFQVYANIFKTSSSIGYAVPQVGSPFAMTYGGQQLGAVLEGMAGAAEIGASISNYEAQRSLTMAGYNRREEDWTFNKELASYEIENIKKQIATLEIKVKSAKQEFEIHKKTILQGNEVYNILKNKFNNVGLYSWMVGRISLIYWQMYQIGLNMAHVAEKAYQLEFGCDDKFINFNNWDSMKKGLLAGEGLQLALNQMEASYYNKNKRALEVEKTISLAMISPEALLNLKSSGKCSFELTEKMFDYDFPGHYLRKIKSISISVPAVVGPFQNIKATLVQKNNSVVTKPSLEAVTYLLGNKIDNKPKEGIRENWLPNQKITISKGIDDSGMFLLNFNDERYLPFEGTGVISSWELEMLKETNRFNFDSISDVIINIKYTALEDSNFKKNVIELLSKSYPYVGGLYFPLQQIFSTEWNMFINECDNQDLQSFNFDISLSQLSFFREVNVKAIYIKLDVLKDIILPVKSDFITIENLGMKETVINLNKDIGMINNINLNMRDIKGKWSIKMDLEKMKKDKDLKNLLKENNHIDCKKLYGMEMVLDYESKIF